MGSSPIVSTDVADRSDVWPAPGRAGRAAVALRGYRLGLAEHPRGREGPRSRGPLHRPGRPQDAPQQAAHRPPPSPCAALRRHREDMRALELYDDEGFVFCSRNGTPMTMSNMRRAFQLLCRSAGFGSDWTTYELRHSFVSLVSDQLDDLVKVADLAGHVDTRTTEGYRHAVRASIPHAIDAWDRLLTQGQE